MAAIAPRGTGLDWIAAIRIVAACAAVALPLRADRASDVRAEVGHIASALSAGNPTDAMTPFEKSCPQYQTLSDDFQSLNAYQMQNEIDVVDEEDSEMETKLTLNWTLTLTDQESDATERRTGEIHVRLVPKDGKWKIVAFEPISLFDPQRKSERKR